MFKKNRLIGLLALAFVLGGAGLSLPAACERAMAVSCCGMSDGNCCCPTPEKSCSIQPQEHKDLSLTPQKFFPPSAVVAGAFVHHESPSFAFPPHAAAVSVSPLLISKPSARSPPFSA